MNLLLNLSRHLWQKVQSLLVGLQNIHVALLFVLFGAKDPSDVRLIQNGVPIELGRLIRGPEIQLKPGGAPVTAPHNKIRYVRAQGILA